jgi:CHAT domain-containing protein
MNLRVNIGILSALMLGLAASLGSDIARLHQHPVASISPELRLTRLRTDGKNYRNLPLARAIALRGDQSVAARLLKQGTAKYQANRFKEAIGLWQQALTAFRQTKNRQGEEEALSLLTSGYLAISDDSRLFAIAEQWSRIASNESNRGRALGYMGLAHKNLGNYPQSIELQQQAITIFQKLLDPQSTGQVLNNLGGTYAIIGDYDRALPIFQKSLAIAKQLKDTRSEANVLSNLGALSTDQGKDRQALTYYQQSLKLAQLPTINDLTLQTGISINLGTTYHLIDQTNLGMNYYQRGLKLAKQINNAQLQGDVLTNLGLIYEDRQNYAQSIQAHQQSIAIAQANQNPRSEARSRNNLAHVFLAAKQLTEAETQLKTAVKLLDRVRSQLTDSQQINIFDTQVATYNLLIQVFTAENKPEPALEALEKGRSRAFAQLLSTRFSDSAKVQTAKVTNLETPSIDRIRQIAKEQNATLVSYGIIPDDSFKFRGNQRAREEELFIWVVQPNGKTTFRRVNLKPLWKRKIGLQDLVKIGLCLDKAPICPTIDEFVNDRQAREGNSKFADQPAGNSRQTLPSGKYPGLKELYQLLVAPINDLLPTNPEAEVVFIPQDSLLSVPFAALQTPDNKFLIEKHTIRTSPSIQVLGLTHQQRQRQRQRQSSQSSIVVVGNPTMPSVELTIGASRQKLAPLPEAEKEAKNIAKLFNTQAIVGSAATKVNVLPKFQQARLIHLATHGLLEYKSRNGSIQKELPGAIALAPTGTDDGLLTASEIFDLNLKAELVVLSACDTGSGRITGDGVIGLSRALLAAGVPSTIVSLRGVPDEQTSVLMLSFYQNWQKNPNIAVALRRATLGMMKEFPDPRDWGAFIAIGESE